MAKYFVQDTSLVNIARAIREKTGSTENMLLKDMPDAIRSISGTASGGVLLKPAEYPDYVRQEAARVANEARKYIKEDSIVSICLSDTHYANNNSTVYKSGLHAVMAIKALTHLLPVDFIAHLGDVGSEGGNDKTNTADLEVNQLEMISYLKELSGESIPLFVAVGNHDSGDYITHGDYSDLMSGDFLYENFTSLSNSSYTTFAGEEYGGYCYRDFEAKKLRVFLLNSMDDLLVAHRDNGPSAQQRIWFIQQLEDLNKKNDAADWSFIVLCHYPADYAINLSEIIKAYIQGGNIAIQESSLSYATSFKGINKARFIVQYHGHIHNCLQTKIRDSSNKEYNALRVAIPQTEDLADRYNHYGGIWQDSATYYKTPNSAKDTSLVVNIINRNEDQHCSIYYGAGPELPKEVDLSGDYWIINNVMNKFVQNSNGEVYEVLKGASYECYIQLKTEYNNSDHYIESVTVIQGSNKDITDLVYDKTTGRIYIESVEGNIKIIANGSPYNKLRIAQVSPTNETIYGNNLGYVVGKRISTSSGTTQSVGGSWSNGVLTGYIPVKSGDVVRISGVTAHYDSTTTSFIALFDSNCNNIPYEPDDSLALGNSYGWTRQAEDTLRLTSDFIVDGAYECTIPTLTNRTVEMMRISIQYVPGDLDEANFSVTINKNMNSDDSEETVYYNISTNFDANTIDVVGNQNGNQIAENDMYTATLTPKNGYQIKNVTIKMSGIDITQNENVYSVEGDIGNIKISSVTGDIEIIIQTEAKTASNLIRQSVDENDQPFNNGKGWITGSYISSGNGTIGSDTTCEVTGFIEVSYGDQICFENLPFNDTSSRYRISYYDASKTYIGTINSQSSYGNPIKDDNGNWLEFTVNSAWSGSAVVNLENVVYMRVASYYITDESIITKK